MNDLKKEIADEIRKRNQDMSDDNIKKLGIGLEEEIKKTTFISRLSSPATIISVIVGYAIGAHLPDDAFIQIGTGILYAAATEHLISSVRDELNNENKYREAEVEAAYKDVDRIYNFARNALGSEEQRERREAIAYRVMMNNPRTRLMII